MEKSLFWKWSFFLTNILCFSEKCQVFGKFYFHFVLRSVHNGNITVILNFAEILNAERIHQKNDKLVQQMIFFSQFIYIFKLFCLSDLLGFGFEHLRILK